MYRSDTICNRVPSGRIGCLLGESAMALGALARPAVRAEHRRRRHLELAVRAGLRDGHRLAWGARLRGWRGASWRSHIGGAWCGRRLDEDLRLSRLQLLLLERRAGP